MLMDSFNGSIEVLTTYRTVSLYNQCSGYQCLTHINFCLVCCVKGIYHQM